MDRIFSIYKRLLELHIKTKTTCPLFHEKSAAFYELLFGIFHQVEEKKQDIKAMDTMGEEAYVEAYELLEEAKQILEDMVKRPNASIGMDNLLRGLVDKLESECGNARGFVNEENEDKMDELLNYK